MSVPRRVSLTIILLCVLVAVGSYSAAGFHNNPSWESVLGNNPPGEFSDASINFQDTDVQYKIDFDNNGDNPLSSSSDSLVQIYIDTGNDIGVDRNTYTDGSNTTQNFYENLGTLNADYRVSIGDDTNVVEPWDSATTQFDGSNSENVQVKTVGGSAVVQFDQGAIGSPDEIDYKFVYIDDTSTSVSGGGDYAWAPDSDPSKFDFTEGDTVKVGTLNATVNISNASVADGTDVEFALGDGTDETIDHDSSSNVTQEFSVDSGVFDEEPAGTITVTIDGENYTLDKTKAVDVSEGSTTNVTFEPHERIDVSGEISGLDNEDGSYTINVNNDDDETIATTEAVTFDGTTSSKSYSLNVNATEFLEDSEVAATLDAPPNTISVDSNASFNTTRYNPEDVVRNFTVSPPNQQLNLTASISEANEFNTNKFNLTVTASANTSGTSKNRIDTIKHVIEFDPTQVNVKETTSLVDSGGNETDTRTGDGVHETVVVNASGSPVVSTNGSSVPIYNATFEFVDDFEPLHGDSTSSDNTVDVSITTVEEDETSAFGATRILNGTEEYGNTKDLEFDTSPAGDVSVFNSETKIQFDSTNVEHLTTGGDMVDAPVKFSVDGVTSNDGEIKEIVLKNTRASTEPDTINCENDLDCSGDLEATPGNSTFVDNGSYVSRNIFNITAIPAGDGTEKKVSNPRGPGQEIYKRADVSLDGTDDDTGNVTLSGDVRSILDLRGRTAGELPWGDIESAQHDVNNDGEIDIVDVTIVASEYEP